MPAPGVRVGCDCNLPYGQTSSQPTDPVLLRMARSNLSSLRFVSSVTPS